jgi:arylsulfatase A-like enzyme
MRYRFLVAAGILAAALAATRLDGLRAPATPNVVLIMMDDLGYGDVGSYGAPDAKTPNIDRLAREGVRLTDAYANGAVCTPTRTALITGRYQQRYGLERALTLADTEAVLPVTGMSLPALLKTNGYATALIGKWHLGFKRAFGPRAHGFDEFFGFLEGAHDYYVGGLYEDTTPVTPRGYLTDEITDRSVAFITRQRTAPFFLEVAYNAVHWPFQPPNRPPRDTVGRRGQRLLQLAIDSMPATRADYVQMLERADEGIGKILAALDRRGLTRNTLVIFTNDNGGEWLSRNAPFFHRKGTLWEGGIRVPLIMRWPGELPAGRTSAQVALTMDVNASIISATRTKTPESYRPDGIDIIPVLRGTTPIIERRVFWRLPPPEVEGNLATQAARQQRAARSGHMKLMVEGGHFFLFDLATDPGERNDLAAQRPALVRSLWLLFQEWERSVNEEQKAMKRAG